MIFAKVRADHILLLLSPYLLQRQFLDTMGACWFHTVDYSFVAAVPDRFKSIYGWNNWRTGLAYSPRGAGIILGNYFTGKLLDHNYKNVARRIGRTEFKTADDELLEFPIEQSWTRGSFGRGLSTLTMAGYGLAPH